MSDERAAKTCPDCAESVLVDARACRFCGYRFDGAPAAGQSEVWARLFTRGRARSLTATQLLRRWGVRLGEGEGTPELIVAEIDGVNGYAVISATRFRFMPSSRRGDVGPAEHVHDLSRLLRVHEVRSGLHRALAIEWDDARTLVAVGGTERRRLQELLRSHQAAGRA